jgi:hypothetical protein
MDISGQHGSGTCAARVREGRVYGACRCGTRHLQMRHAASADAARGICRCGTRHPSRCRYTAGTRGARVHAAARLEHPRVQACIRSTCCSSACIRSTCCSSACIRSTCCSSVCKGAFCSIRVYSSRVWDRGVYTRVHVGVRKAPTHGYRLGCSDSDAATRMQ